MTITGTITVLWCNSDDRKHFSLSLRPRIPSSWCNSVIFLRKYTYSDNSVTQPLKGPKNRCSCVKKAAWRVCACAC
jgi:hypothetical protein